MAESGCERFLQAPAECFFRAEYQYLPSGGKGLPDSFQITATASGAYDDLRPGFLARRGAFPGIAARSLARRGVSFRRKAGYCAPFLSELSLQSRLLFLEPAYDGLRAVACGEFRADRLQTQFDSAGCGREPVEHAPRLRLLPRRGHGFGLPPSADLCLFGFDGRKGRSVDFARRAEVVCGKEFPEFELSAVSVGDSAVGGSDMEYLSVRDVGSCVHLPDSPGVKASGEGDIHNLTAPQLTFRPVDGDPVKAQRDEDADEVLPLHGLSPLTPRMRFWRIPSGIRGCGSMLRDAFRDSSGAPPRRGRSS